MTDSRDLKEVAWAVATKSELWGVGSLRLAGTWKTVGAAAQDADAYGKEW